ncbi:MAG: hypothetical protein JW863_21710 [Chitinispirillaceae bacterium]|nr:hypothetical protein [Chitinispirillaceae bacterium]
MKRMFPLPLYLLLMTTALFSKSLIPPDHPAIQYMGRIDRHAPDRVLFDWPGITIRTTFEGTSCAAELEGVNCFDAYIDGVLSSTFCCKTAKSIYQIAEGLTDRPHRLVLTKRSESAGAPSAFYGFLLDSGKTVTAPPPLSDRKIEFIGDSYTVGFSNEYMRMECPPGKDDSIMLSATNSYKAFGPLTARAFGAQYHIIAISGKGLVRNYNGIDKGRELPVYYDRTLISSVNKRDKSSRWDFSQWKADVVVIGLGINDFQGDPPYADSTKFDGAYIALIERLRKQYPGVKIICCATKVWPDDNLIPRVKAIVERQGTAGHQDVKYFEYHTENGALYGHPHIYDHQKVSRELIPVMAEVTGWHRTDMMRGK